MWPIFYCGHLGSPYIWDSMRQAVLSHSQKSVYRYHLQLNISNFCPPDVSMPIYILPAAEHERGSIQHACISTSLTSSAPALELWWWPSWWPSSSSTEQEEGRRRPMISCRPRGPVAIVLVVLVVAVRPPTEGSSTWVVGRSRWKWDLQKAQISLFKNRTDNAIYLNFLLLFFIGLWDLLISGLLYPMDQKTPWDFFPSSRMGTSYLSEAVKGLEKK